MALLEVSGLAAFYRDFQALRNVSMSIDACQIVAVIGANGAGKSTLLNSIAGLIDVDRSCIRLDGESTHGLRPSSLVGRGISLVPEGRRLFPSLSVEENLLIGGHLGRLGPWSLERIFALFPALEERRHQRSTSLSGGQQQMVAIGRALMSNPRVLLCDELSLGLAPIIIKNLYAQLPAIVAEGTSMILVEQDIAQAMKVADRVYCFQEGRVSLSGRPEELTREQVHLAYFGH